MEAVLRVFCWSAALVCCFLHNACAVACCCSHVGHSSLFDLLPYMHVSVDRSTHIEKQSLHATHVLLIIYCVCMYGRVACRLSLPQRVKSSCCVRACFLCAAVLFLCALRMHASQYTSALRHLRVCGVCVVCGVETAGCAHAACCLPSHQTTALVCALQPVLSLCALLQRIVSILCLVYPRITPFLL